MPTPWFSRLRPALPSRPASARQRRLASRRSRPQMDVLEGRQLLSTFTVNTDEDSGPGSLRQALIDSNATPATPTSPNTINFGFATGGVQITLASQLPTITQPLVIDASNLGTRKPAVQLIGNYAGSALGLDIAASGTVVRNLAINGFSSGGVLIDGASNVTIDKDFIGLNPNQNAFGPDQNGNVINEANGVYGLTITNGAQHNVISNDEISNNIFNGLIISGANTNFNVVEGSLIGTDNTGSSALDDNAHTLGNGQQGGGGSGIVINQGAAFNTIGGTTAAARNVIVNNKSFGVYITNNTTHDNVVAGNYIGINSTGTGINDGAGHAIGNGQAGVEIATGSYNNRITGTYGASQIISGNLNNGIVITDPFAIGNVVQGVFIGTDVNGSTAEPNVGDGVLITNSASSNTIGGTTFVTNIISGNTGNGVELSGGAVINTVSANLIGTNGSGLAALPNGGDGVLIGGATQSNTIGSTTAALRNIISGNAVNGVELSGQFDTANVVEGNYIGTTAAGTGALGNANNGVLIHNQASDNVIGAGNVISGNGTWGVYISDPGTSTNVVKGNYIGTDATGTIALPNANNGLDIVFGATSNTVGGTTAAARNVISGNANEGVLIGFAGTALNVVEGNFIGTTAAGTAALPNGLDGVLVTSGATTNTIGTGNVISGNKVDGVLLVAGANNNQVIGSQIGTDVSGKLLIGNGKDGVEIQSSSQIDVNSDTIANNAQYGVENNGGIRAGIFFNSIFANGLGGIYEFNDPSLVPAPSLTGAVTYNGQTFVFGSLSAPALVSTTVTIEFFSNVSGKQGQTMIGQIAVKTDANGNASFAAPFNTVVPAGQTVTATAIDLISNTSMFSNAVTVALEQPPVLTPVNNQTIPVGTGIKLALSSTNPGGLPLTFSGVAETQAYYLKSTLGLYQDPGGTFTNFRGHQEKYLRGKASATHYNNGGGDYWYYILPNGDLYEFTPPYSNTTLTGALVAHLGTSFYNDTTLLTNAANTPPATVNAFGNIITVLPNPSIPSVFYVVASVTDGVASSSSTFTITIAASSPPVLTPINDVTIPAGGKLTVTIPATDPASLPLTYTAQAQTQAFQLKQQYGLYEDAGGFYTNFRGQQEKYLRGKTSATHYNSGGGDYWYYILPSGDLYEFTPPYTNQALTGALVAHLGTAFYADPTLLTNATNAASLATLSVSGNQLTIVPAAGTSGSFVVVVTASDGSLSTSETFKVTVHSANQAPVLAPIADQVIPRLAAELLPVTATDPDKDTLTLSAVAETQTYYLKSTLGLYQDPGGTFTNFRGQQEKYLRGKVSANNYNNGGGDYWYYILPNGDLYEFTPPYSNQKLTGVLVAHLGTVVYNDPTLLTSALNTPVPVSLSASINQIAIAPNPGYTGTFVIIATVSDGLLSSSTTFRVTAS